MPWCGATWNWPQKVLAMDDQVDHYRDQIFRELLTYMMGDSSVVVSGF